jgi:hypothetical protein
VAGAFTLPPPETSSLGRGILDIQDWELPQLVKFLNYSTGNFTYLFPGSLNILQDIQAELP